MRDEEFPQFPEYLRGVTDFYPHFVHWDKLSVLQLKECWSVCEQQKRYCHPESVFQPLIDRDMRKIAEEIKKRKKNF
jgi:hypothetical protein